MRILVLGGTNEASALARALAQMPGIEAELSLAGRTAHPVAPPIPHRVGGFGGVDGLAAYLVSGAFDAVVDATHPFAAEISRNAAEACARVSRPLVAFSRAPWRPEAGDRWTEVADASEAVEAVGPDPATVFLTVGRLALPAFAAAPQHRYLIRTIDPPAGLEALPDHRLILARGPFQADAEAELMRSEGIEVLVTKNSGGEATAAKLVAARRLGLPVMMIRRPPPPEVERLHELAAVMAWIERHRPAP